MLALSRATTQRWILAVPAVALGLASSPAIAQTTATERAAMLVGVIVVALLAVAMAALVAAYIWHDRRRQRRDASDALPALADALRHVDLFGEAAPKLDFQASGAAGEVTDAVNHLFDRLNQYKQRLLARDQRMRRMLGTVTDILYQTDSNHQITWVTDSVERVLGYTADDVRGHRIDEFLVDAGKDNQALNNRSQITNYPIRVYRRDGSVAWLLVSVRRLRDADGRFIGTEGVCRDGTDLIEAEQALFKERKRAQTTLASIGDGVITTTIAGVVDYMNPSAEALTGATRLDGDGRRFDEICHLRDCRTGKRIRRLVDTCIETEHDVHLQREVTLYNPQLARDFAVKVNVSPIRDSRNEITGTVVVLHDITELREISRQMTHQANHDTLTGLANRQAFERRLRRLLETARLDGTTHALCYLDLDQFKIVNDTCGHTAGDELLRRIATQLANEVRENDFIARLGGDEFGVLLHDTALEQAKRTAERMRGRIEDFRLNWKNKLFRTAVSIGVVPITSQSGSLADVLSNADAACYIAKDSGRNRVHIYSPDSDEVSSHYSDMQRMQRLSEAIDRGAFVLFAQVIRAVDWQPGDPFSLEYLVRMRANDGGLLNPAAFLPIAERYQMMPQIDRWVLQNAIDLIVNAPPAFAQVDYFSINLSGQSMTDDYFIDFALGLLRDSGVDARRLVFEITETSAVTNFSRAAHLIKVLRDMGCRFALDDFGSGLSSFSYLKNLPLDFIKIDGAFVRDVLTDPVDLETVKAINQVGHTMGLKTIAEYVESKAVLEMLRSIGVDYAQGYHIARPMPFEELINSAHFRQRRSKGK